MSSLLRVIPLADAFDRCVTYLRLSLTDRCNYRCTYCMPEAGVHLVPREEVLTHEEIERLVGCFARLGVTRVRLTGGEPTVRQGVVEIAARVAAVAGIAEVMMTTNGHRLPELARPLRQAGVSRLNVSIDTLDAERFSAITRRGDLARVIAGVEAARVAGYSAIKINVVALRGFNDRELGALCTFAWERGLVPRFIEWMPLSGGDLYAPGQFLPAAEIRGEIERQLGVRLAADDTGVPGSGPARYFADARGRKLGIISALTEHFCETCNRVRVSATGQLHTCLASDDATDLRALLRTSPSDEPITTAIRAALHGKQEGHSFTPLGQGAPRKHMVAIGG